MSEALKEMDLVAEESRAIAVSSFYEKVARIIDVTGIIGALVISIPIFAFIALAIKLTSRGPIIHRTSRLGLRGEPFVKYKFRTMIANAEAVLQKLLQENEEIRKEYYSKYKIKDDPRITVIGKFLRKSSLDELPQLFNILKGDMRLVGPRDIIPSELEEHYSHCKDKFLSVKPGLTGLWQVSGRSRLPYEERVRLDMYYIDHRSLRLDVKILLKTPIAVFRGDGAV